MSKDFSHKIEARVHSNRYRGCSGKTPVEELLEGESEDSQFMNESRQSRITNPQVSHGWPNLPFSDVLEWECKDMSEEIHANLSGVDQSDPHLIALERTQMTLEDFRSHLLRSQLTPLTVEMTQDEIGKLKRDIEQLEAKGNWEIQMGALMVQAKIVKEQMQTTKEASLLRPLIDIRIRLPLYSSSLTSMKTEDIYKEKVRLYAERRTLKETIEKLLECTDQENSTTPCLVTESAASPEGDWEDRKAHCEAELDALRRKVAALRLEGVRLNATQKELDFAEDLLVRVRYGEDVKKFFAQLEVVKSCIVQTKAQRAVSETERIASALDLSIRILEKDRSLLQAKARIKKKVMERFSAGDSTLNPSPEISFDHFRRPLVSLTSTPDIADERGNLTDRVRGSDTRTKEAVEFWKKRAGDLQEQLSRYKEMEDNLALEKGRAKASLQELQLRKESIDNREQTLFQQEVSLALMEDRFRTLLSQNLTQAEALEFLRVRATELMEERQRVDHERLSLELELENLQRREFEFSEHRRVLDRKLRRVNRDKKQVDQMKEQIFAARKELKMFLSQLITV